jgi:hypothetical protein
LSITFSLEVQSCGKLQPTRSGIVGVAETTEGIARLSKAGAALTAIVCCDAGRDKSPVRIEQARIVYDKIAWSPL